MKRKVLLVTTFFVIIITTVSVLFLFGMNQNSRKNIYRKEIVELNEIKNIANLITDDEEQDNIDKLKKAVDNYETLLRSKIKDDANAQAKVYVTTEYIICLLFLFTVFGYIYISILKPFDKMKVFAGKIANGNFDESLRYERSNYFGAFTWAFDNMRKEIIQARRSEKEAILNNKTVIAAIVHDIKSPITSIRAYAEGLANNLDSDPQRRTDYIDVIIRKCDEVAKLTNDLFLHSVSDLEKLKIEAKPENIKKILCEVIDDFNGGLCKISLNSDIPECTVMLDKQRFEQVIENIISNSLKYAGTDIDVSGRIVDKDYLICLRDYGSGIPDEDLPFVFGKFYRGRNSKDKHGSGLGLYISEYIMSKHDGSLKLYNHVDGLEAVISFPICFG